MTYKKDEDEYCRRLEALQEQGVIIPLSMDALYASCVIASLQLALRHPDNKGTPARMAKEVVDVLIGKFEELDPKLGPLLRQGYNPACDVRRGPDQADPGKLGDGGFYDPPGHPPEGVSER